MPPVNRNKPVRAKSSDSQYSLVEFMQRYPDDDACLTFLWNTRYAPDGEHAHCPKCEQERSFKRYAIVNRNTSWTCTACGHHVHPTAGTIFHKSSTSLHLWFYAMYIMASTRCGVSAKQLERELGVTYKTAWRMFHLIRNQLMTQDDDAPLDGEVEMDEMFHGGKVRASELNRIAQNAPSVGHRRSQMAKAAEAKKTTVFGMVERGGRVSAHVVPSRRKGTLMGHVEERVLPSAIIFTDEMHSYDGLASRGYQHNRIQHQAHVYVRGNIHTNTIEGFWSLVKNGIRGSHHAVSAKHLQGYLNEYAWRYNHRDDRRAMFDLLLLRAALTTPGA